jgi:hypothetical protein
MTDITNTRADIQNNIKGDINSLIETLREFKNPITDQVANMLDPHGDTYWRLNLKRRRRGRPAQPSKIWWEYQELLKDLGNYKRAISNALYLVADRNNTTEAAVRSVVRRMSGTHGGRRKKKSGHK